MNWLFMLHFFFFLLALFTKENAIMFIPLLLFYLYFVYKKKLLRKDYLILSTGYFLCLVPWFILRHWALSYNIDRTPFSFKINTIFQNSPLFIQYISKSVLPFNLSVMTTVADTNYTIGILAIGLILAGILLSKKKNSLFILFGACWFLLFLTPSLISSFNGLEHRAYLPLVGMIFIISQFDIIKAPGLTNNSNHGKMGIALLSLIFVVFSYISFKRLPLFKNRFTFDESAMRSSPQALLPCLYLAAHYEQEKMYTQAIDAYKEGLKRDSAYDLTYLNMAGDYICLNNYKDAEKILKLALRRNPANSTATFNLGLVVFQGDTNYKEGVRLWKKAIALDSDFAQPYKVLSEYYQATGDSANAKLYRSFYNKKRVK